MEYNAPPGSQDPNAPYVNGIPGVQKGSPVNGHAVEYTQREILAVIEAAGLTPTNEELDQLLRAIRLLGPDISTFVQNSRRVDTTAPLAGGGDLSSNRTLTIRDASTSASGAVQLSSVISATNATQALTPKGAWDAKKLTVLSTRSTTGSWSITGVNTDFPLWIVMDGTNTTNDSECQLKVVSGSSTGRAPYGGSGGSFYVLWADTFSTAGASSNVFLCIPTSTTVVIQLNLMNGVTLYALQ